MIEFSSKDDIEQKFALAKISQHLELLAEKVLALEETICCGFTSQPNAIDNERYTELQSLDFLRQSLQDLALLMHFMETYIPNPVLSALPLDDFASKLKLSVTKELICPTKNTPHKKNSGDIDLF